MARAGQFGIITRVCADETVFMTFDDGRQHKFPFEAIERQVGLRFCERTEPDSNANAYEELKKKYKVQERKLKQLQGAKLKKAIDTKNRSPSRPGRPNQREGRPSELLSENATLKQPLQPSDRTDPNYTLKTEMFEYIRERKRLSNQANNRSASAASDGDTEYIVALFEKTTAVKGSVQPNLGEKENPIVPPSFSSGQ